MTTDHVTQRTTWLRGEVLLVMTAHGKPKGAQRHRAFRRGAHLVMAHAPDHLDAEERIRRTAAEAWQGRQPIDVPVVVEIGTWHARPKALCRKRDHGARPSPYMGKPDADNVAKLVMDALTKAGVWTDDTRVADLVVRRRYLGLDEAGLPEGVERVEVVVRACGEVA
jgi:Holliday junction resolvase RusA-like endonuclease